MTMLQFSSPHANGMLEVSGPEINLFHEAETLQCVHCGCHFEINPGSGVIRGYCFKCGGVTCNQKLSCEECEPQEAVLEKIEAKERLQHLILEQQAHAEFDYQLARLRGK